MALSAKTPGVYINEIDAFPNSVVPVPTAIPAFIGYTPKAEYEGKSYLNKPVKISSFADFQAFFTVDNEPGKPKKKQYSPQFYLEPVEGASGDNLLNINGVEYELLPDPNTIYYLYNAIRLFYQNGGGDAYIVSVGTYGDGAGKPVKSNEPIVNENVVLNELQGGVELLKTEQDPTMYICPEATLLSVDENGTLMESMLLQAAELKTAICVFDIIGGSNPKEDDYQQSISTFRNKLGTNGLDFGTAYFPFVNTTVSDSYEVDYGNFFGGDDAKLEAIINPNSDAGLAQTFKDIRNPESRFNPIQINNALTNLSPDYKNIIVRALHQINTLPTSAAMAGVMTTIDNNEGVWKAPANTSMVAVADIPFKLNDEQQGELNVDAVSGKSINALRYFNGQGVLVWGARTLDGNSLDWRYLSVRRTMTFIEQSAKLAARAYVFESNVSNTWISVKTMIDNFLTSIWKQGALLGAKPSDAFSVSVGLGSTMTADDILNGLMRVSIKVAIVHPAEFIVIEFEQEQAKS